MYQAFPDLVQQLHSLVMNQEARIQALEKVIQELEKELKELKQRPTLHVDRIEYKFDQLKVETLDGTLNIGLNPADLQNIEDFAVHGNHPMPMMDPKQQFQRNIELEDEVYQYLETDLAQLIQLTAEKMDRKLEENYLDFIKEDIKKQLPARIQYYLQQRPLQNDSRNDEEWKKHVIAQLIKEMEHGIRTFIGNLPK